MPPRPVSPKCSFDIAVLRSGRYYGKKPNRSKQVIKTSESNHTSRTSDQDLNQVYPNQSMLHISLLKQPKRAKPLLKQQFLENFLTIGPSAAVGACAQQSADLGSISLKRVTSKTLKMVFGA